MNILDHKNSELLIVADASDKKTNIAHYHSLEKYVMPPNAIIITKKKSIRNADEAIIDDFGNET